MLGYGRCLGAPRKLHIFSMAQQRGKKTEHSRRSATAEQRVYRGIKIAHVSDKRSATANATRDAASTVRGRHVGSRRSPKPPPTMEPTVSSAERASPSSRFTSWSDIVSSPKCRRPFKHVEIRLSQDRALTTTSPVSARMARVRQHGTAPELAVRRIATSLGLRYRVSNKDLPGNPDLANRTRKFAIFVHGCYWHRHAGCGKSSTPKVNVSFWAAKFARNLERDEAATRELRNAGFRVIVVWECETRKLGKARSVLCELASHPETA
jgi:DNA mismatch endonuclease (patch repair protein)